MRSTEKHARNSLIHPQSNSLEFVYFFAGRWPQGAINLGMDGIRIKLAPNPLGQVAVPDS
jgi:hypothetical protein